MCQPLVHHCTVQRTTASLNQHLLALPNPKAATARVSILPHVATHQRADPKQRMHTSHFGTALQEGTDCLRGKYPRLAHRQRAQQTRVRTARWGARASARACASPASRRVAWAGASCAPQTTSARGRSRRRRPCSMRPRPSAARVRRRVLVAGAEMVGAACSTFVADHFCLVDDAMDACPANSTASACAARASRRTRCDS